MSDNSTQSIIEQYGNERTPCYVYFAIALMVFISEDTLFFGTNRITFYHNIAQYIIFLIAIFAMIVLLIRKSSFSNRKPIIICILLIISLWISCAANSDPTPNYFYRTGLIVCAFFIAQILSRRHFLRAYEFIVRLIAVVSIVLYIFHILLPELLDLLPSIENTSGYIFRNALLSVAPYKGYAEYARSYGIFREPGVFAVFLILGVYIQLFENKKFLLRDLLIYVVAIILTFSTTAYITFVMLFLLFVFRNKTITTASRKIILLLGFFALWIILSLFTDFLSSEGIILGKFDPQSTSYSSGISRLASVVVNGRIFLRNPLFGVGSYRINFMFQQELLQTSQISTIGVHNTNTLMMGLSTYGIIFGIVVMISLYKFFRLHNGILMSVLLFALAYVLFSGESFLNNILFYLLVFYGISETRAPKSLEISHSVTSSDTASFSSASGKI